MLCNEVTSEPKMMRSVSIVSRTLKDVILCKQTVRVFMTIGTSDVISGRVAVHYKHYKESLQVKVKVCKQKNLHGNKLRIL